MAPREPSVAGYAPGRTRCHQPGGADRDPDQQRPLQPVRQRALGQGHVIPCCANLERITALASRRDEVRRQLGLRDATVMIYVGKFPSWSMPMAMAGFFAAASELIEDLHFLILTQGDGEAIRAELTRAGATAQTYTITSAPAAEVGAYLAASDFAITFIQPAPSTVGQSPTSW